MPMRPIAKETQLIRLSSQCPDMKANGRMTKQ